MAGVAWVFIALVVLQFDEVSIRTVGTLIGIMFLLSGVQHLALAAMVDMHGVTDIVRAFQIRRLPDDLVKPDAALRRT